MKVLIVNRVDALENFGGDTMQMLETQKALKEMGIDVETVLGVQTIETYSKYDIIHFFNIQTEEFTYDEVIKAKSLGKKIVVSPIWWNYEQLMNDLPDNFYTKKARIVKKILGKKMLIFLKKLNQKKRNKKRIKILDIADQILPNSNMEIDCLKESFDKDYSYKCKVVYNGISEKYKDVGSVKQLEEIEKQGYIPFNYATQVGRVEIGKNTLLTIRACKELNIPLIIIGKWSNDEYFYECKKEAEGHKVLFLGKRSTEEIISVNSNAKLHILPSFRETPGLASLEAGALGCNIVSTIVGSTEEYFENYAYYCNPLDYKSIKSSIREAWENDKNKKLRELILNNYTWNIAAKQTLEAYEFCSRG
ncbi:glycosyltransferase family 4 protein [Clostridium sp. 'White wine YQ']|uniref:glycosyltransferase family 4 protein n=1 Tax=Clostridium sp. 'White wine YQ' TaxID=3027474 RepID=UPI0023655BFC|nr:glycosyltransferase family 4 protein [Clostridium sp. 'White wine YQ']MDD7792753.1 glycosyltransferase family 4 protein [Clostridium sp. 'White wine YQ']